MGKPAPSPTLDREEIIETLTDNYLESLVWSQLEIVTDDDEHAHLYPERFSDELKAHGREVCTAFYNAVLAGMGDVAPFLLLSTQKMGHDLALTRNGHGSGFWDGGWDDFGEDVGDKLTKMAKALGEVNVYRQDDGKIGLM